MSLFGFGERRSLENPSRPLTAANLVEMFGGARNTDAGVNVTETGAMKQSAVYRATALISSQGGALPLHTYKSGTKERARSALLENPHPDLTPLELWRLNFVHRCLWGNGFQQKVRNGAGQVTWLYPITPERVSVVKVQPEPANPSGKLYDVTDDWGNSHVLDSRDILHIPHIGWDGTCGLSPVRLAAQAIGLATAAETHGAKLFGSGNLLSGFIKTDQRLEQQQAEALRARWRDKMNGLGSSHEVAILDSGATFQSLTMPNDDAQLLQSREFQISDIARFFGVPAFLLGQTEKSTSWGTGLEQQAQGFVTFDLGPMWLAPTEQRITKELLPRSQYAKYQVNGLLRGDSTARSAFYRVMRELGAYSANDIRDLEDLPPVENGDGRLQPMNFVELGAPPASPATSTPPADVEGDDEDPAASAAA